jgi:hypothetical protein
MWRNGSILAPWHTGEGDGRRGVDCRRRRLGLEEEESWRGMGGPAWAERPNGVGRFQGKGVRATTRMRAKI